MLSNGTQTLVTSPSPFIAILLIGLIVGDGPALGICDIGALFYFTNMWILVYAVDYRPGPITY